MVLSFILAIIITSYPEWEVYIYHSRVQSLNFGITSLSYFCQWQSSRYLCEDAFSLPMFPSGLQGSLLRRVLVGEIYAKSWEAELQGLKKKSLDIVMFLSSTFGAKLCLQAQLWARKVHKLHCSLCNPGVWALSHSSQAQFLLCVSIALQKRHYCSS